MGTLHPGILGIDERPIGQGSHLHGSVDTKGGQTFFTVKGPCGERHTMNAKEAKRLLLWLEINLDEVDPGWRLKLALELPTNTDTEDTDHEGKHARPV